MKRRVLSRRARQCPVGATQKGVAVLELALVMALILVPLLLAMVEGARALSAYRTLTHQVNAAARYLSVFAPGVNHDQAKCLLKTGYSTTVCATAADLLPGLSGGSIEVLDSSNDSNSALLANEISSTPKRHVSTVTVKVSGYVHEFIFLNFVGMQNITLTPVAVTYRQVN